MSVVSMNKLLEAGVHFGHQTRRWNPKMNEYIYTSRNGIYIIDLQKTVKKLEDAYKVMNKIASRGGKVLFVGTKKQAQKAVKDEAIRSSMYYVDQRWLGGTLTNFKTIRTRIRRMEEIERMERDGIFDVLPKKEVIGLRKEHERLERFLGGIREMKRLPQAIFVVDPRKERNAILEARKLNIPVFGIVDTNCDPDDVDFVIPGNDDAIRAVQLIVGVMANSVVEANGGQVVDYVSNTKRDKNYKSDRPQNRDHRNNDGRYNNNRRNNDGRYNNNRRNNDGKFQNRNNDGKFQNRNNDGKFQNRNNDGKFQNRNNDGKFQNRDNRNVKNDRKFEAPKKENVKVQTNEKPAKQMETTQIDLSKLTVADLKEQAKAKGITGYSKMKKAELVDALK